MKKLRIEKRRISPWRRLIASAVGTCEVCLEKEISMMVACRRNNSKILGVCDDCAADFHNVVPVGTILAYPQLLGAC